MAYDKPIIQTSNPYERYGTTTTITRTIYYGEVISIDDDIEGGRIQVRISDLDLNVNNADLPLCYPLLPKFFHLFPKVGEMVRVFIEDVRYPQRSRFWLGSVISQLQKIEFDNVYNALSTTNIGVTKPNPALRTYPDAKGVFPLKEDVAIVGRVNTDVILKKNEVHIRAGKHDNGNVLKLNVKNPAHIGLVYEQNPATGDFYSSDILLADKIALISHDGNPKFKAAGLTADDRKKIFEQGHPMARADVVVEALNVLRNALINHIHGYSGLNADKTSVINTLEKIDFNAIMQKNIVIN